MVRRERAGCPDPLRLLAQAADDQAEDEGGMSHTPARDPEIGRVDREGGTEQAVEGYREFRRGIRIKKGTALANRR